MNSIENVLPQFAPYFPALLALTSLCLMVLVQSLLTAPFAFIRNEQVPGMPLTGDHNLLSFRVLRTYANSVENLPAFGFLLLVAVLIGVAPAWVNWLAAIHVTFRLAFWVAYYGALGKVTGGPRSLCYVGGALANIVLAVAGIHTILK